MNKVTVFLVIAFLLISGILFLYARFIEPHRLVIENLKIPSSKFARQSDGVKIVQLSDVHIKSIGRYERKVIRTVNELAPDIIVITGDFFDHPAIFARPRAKEFSLQLEHIAFFVSSLRAKHGVFLVRGNNDFSNDKETSDLFLEKMARADIPVLTNSKRYITINGQQLCLLGVDYPEFEDDRVTEFWVSGSSGNRFLESDYSRNNTYSHFFAIDDSSRWQNYTFTGRMRLTDPAKGSIGVTFYSQFYRGYDKFYRLRETAREPNFRFSPHGTNVTGGDQDTGIILKDDRWHWFKVAVHSDSNRAELRAKVWPDGSSEPVEWQAEAYDDSTTHLSGGTVGVWSSGGDYHHFDDLKVVADNGETLLLEDFEDEATGRNAENWVNFNHDHEAIPILMRHVDESCFTVLLAHSPDFMTWEKMDGIDLVLSGHTHGGQIRLPLLGAPLARISLGRKYMSGSHKFGNTWLHVNRGIGTILLPMRFLCPPEITVIEVVEEK